MSDYKTTINSKSYLTKAMLSKILNKKVTSKDADDLVLKGKLIKKYSYYQPTIEFLKELDVIGDKISITNSNSYITLSKTSHFTQEQIQEIFDCHIDVARLIIRKYFYRKHNYFYKTDLLNEKLLDEELEFSL